VEPTLAVVSRDAAIWDMNEVLRHHMLLRTPVSLARRVAAASAPVVPMQKELRSFQEMLQGLKARTISPPPGVSFARLKREVKVLVASTKEIQDDDVLLHGKIESLLQTRLREKSLDGLLALQAAWRLRAKSDVDSPAAEPEATSAAETSAKAGGVRMADATETGEKRWTDDAAEAMDHASEALERKAAEVREKTKKQKAGAMEFQMDLEKGTIELHLGNGLNSLKEVAGDEAISEAVQQAMAQNLQALHSQLSGASGEEADGESSPVKMQVQFVKLEDLVNADGQVGSAAQVLQTLLANQGQGGGAAGAGFGFEALHSLLQAQRAAGIGGGERREGDAEEPSEAEDVVAL